MNKSRVVNVEYVIKKGFEKCKGFDYVNVVLGKGQEMQGDNNYITILPVKDGDSDQYLSTQIETSIKDVVDIISIVTSCLIKSELNFNSVQLLNMDGSAVDVNNLKSDMKLIVRF